MSIDQEKIRLENEALTAFNRGDENAARELLMRADSLANTATDAQKVLSYSPTAESMATVATGAYAKPLAGLAGILSLPFGADESANVTRAVEENLQYMPATQESIGQLQSVSDFLMGLPGVSHLVDLAESYKGYTDPSFEQTYQDAGPGAAAIQKGVTGVVPDMAAAVIGKGIGSALKKVEKSTDTVIKTVSNEPKFVVKDDVGLYTEESIDALRKYYEQRMTPEVSAKIEKARADGAPDTHLDTMLQELLGTPDVLTPNQAIMVNTLKEMNIPVLRPYITQSTDDWANVQEAAKVTGDISKIKARGHEALRDAAQKASEMTGGVALPDNTGGQGARIFGIIDNVVQRSDDAVNAAYKKAREIAPTGKAIKPENILSELRPMLGQESASGGIPSAVKSILEQKGIKIKGNWDPNQRINAETAEQVRQELNALYADTDNARGKRFIGILKDALDSDVEKGVGVDVFSEARQAKIDFHKLIEREKGKRDLTKSSFLEDIVYGKIPESQIMQKYKSARYADKLKFRKFLVDDSGPEGKQVWDDMRAQIIYDAAEAATSNKGKLEGGIKPFDEKIFINKIRQSSGLANDERERSLLFSNSEWAAINKIGKVGEAMRPLSNTQQGYGPSARGIIGAVISETVPGGEKIRGAKNLIDALKRYGKIKEATTPPGKEKATNEAIMQASKEP